MPRPYSSVLWIVATATMTSACHSRERAGSEKPPAANGTVSAAVIAPSSVPSAETSLPAPASRGFTAKLARCGWGAVSSGAAPDSPPWAIALVDVDASSAVKGLHITAVELGGAHGIAAKLGARATLRIQDGATSYSFGAAGTHELSGALPPGQHRLRAAAALDQSKKAVARTHPTTCAVVLTDEAGQIAIATGSIDPEWKNE